MNVPAILKNAAEKCGFNRVRYAEKDIPTSMSNVCVIPFFGDSRSMVVFSSILFHRFREQIKGSKYLIFCSWPGNEGLFPAANEYWSVDKSLVKVLHKQTKGFENTSDAWVTIVRNLNYFFEDVIQPEEFKPYYEFGLQKDFFDRFKNIKVWMPSIPSAVLLGQDFNRELNRRSGYKIFVHPSIYLNDWQQGRVRSVKASYEFWSYLVKRLIGEGFVPVVYQNTNTYDLSKDFTESCIYVTDENVLHVLSAMRSTGCVLDMFTGISRFAILARTPFLCCDERARFNALKEFEIDDLCALQLPKEYIFSFSTIIESGDEYTWKVNIVDTVISKLWEFIPKLDRDTWPSTAEYHEIVPYAIVQRRKAKKLGIRFIKTKSL